MADKSDFVIVAKKDLDKLFNALAGAKEVIENLSGLLAGATGGGPGVKKTRKTRVSKETTPESVATTAEVTQAESVKEIKVLPKVVVASPKAAIAAKANGSKPIPSKVAVGKAKSGFAPAMPH